MAATLESVPILEDDGRAVRLASEVAGATGLSLNTILRAVDRKEIVGRRVGRQTLIPLHEVRRLLALDAAECLVPAGVGVESL